MQDMERFEIEGQTVRIVADSDPESPRSWDNLGIMFCDHRRYSLGDATDISTSECNSWNDVEALLIREHDARVILPLYLLDHSGITMRTTDFGDPWDSGSVGFIFATAADIRKEYGVKRITARIETQVREQLRSEVSVYDSFISGDVYGYVIEDADGEEIDSGYGFYGIEDVRESATVAAKSVHASA